jgi:hypothetical protein
LLLAGVQPPRTQRRVAAERAEKAKLRLTGATALLSHRSGRDDDRPHVGPPDQPPGNRPVHEQPWPVRHADHHGGRQLEAALRACIDALA